MDPFSIPSGESGVVHYVLLARDPRFTNAGREGAPGRPPDVEFRLLIATNPDPMLVRAHSLRIFRLVKKVKNRGITHVQGVGKG